MREVGFAKARAVLLPSLFNEVYGFKLNTNCGSCEKNGFDSLIKWADKRQKKVDMGFSIKKEYHKKNFTFRHQGQVVVVNSNNLTEEKARMMLASPYAHAIEGQPDKVENEFKKVGDFDSIVKKNSDATQSTSNEAKKGGKGSVKVRKGKLSKS